MQNTGLKCVLFDLDGTLANTETLKAAALSQTMKDFGGFVLPEAYKIVMGQSWEVVTAKFFKVARLKIELKEFDPVFREHYSQLIEERLVADNGVLEFLNLLKEKSCKIALVSSASPWMIEKVLTKLGLQNTFDVVVSNNDVKDHKPHPEAYLFALERLNIDARFSVAFEDSESGFVAATRAGVKVFGVRHEYNNTHDFSLCEKTIESFRECISWPLFP